MSRILAESELPAELSPFGAVDAAYPSEITRCYEALHRRLPVLVECEKELAPFLYRSLRDRLKVDGARCLYLDGRASNDLPPPPPGTGLVGAMIHQIREVVRGAVGERIVVLPHIDILTASGGQGFLGAEAREVIPLLYENPEVLWLGFKDPAFPLPTPIDNLFPHKESIVGVPRDRLRFLVTQREAKKFGRGFDPYMLYKHISGVNAVRLRRLLGSLTGEDYPADPAGALRQLRTATLSNDVELPSVDLDKDIGGYKTVKERLQAEILAILGAKDKLSDPAQIEKIESLIPRGMIFWGPPGTGKTLFAKAMATSLGAAVSIVSGPELKSKWVGESEENLRAVFMKARQSAPAVIVFDELDSFAAARGTYTGSGVEHSMVNQLLTEMDGFRKEELVFVVGTTNFVESLDPALMRPGRFEFALHIPYPNTEDRRAILGVHDKRFGLQMTDAAFDYAAKRSGEPVPGPSGGTHYSGDHLQALCRQIARTRLRENLSGPTQPADIDRALEQYLDLPKLTAAEERVVATHEAGHAVCSLHCKHSAPIDRISIRGDIGGALGYVQHSDPAHRYVVTYGQLRDSLCTLFGGREAEVLLCDDISIGSGSDLHHATHIARSMVENYGDGGDDVGVGHWEFDKDRPISEDARAKIDEAVRKILERERARAKTILEGNRVMLTALRDLLLEKKVLDRASFAHLTPPKSGDPSHG
ncbi:MAG: AAA family ATPase [Deltaproteobacteria bacterium]|nr:AAA family ATPase [Deltaproteobacteria bacterium]MCW5805491.1 AAA family ATPase [Deltaproteobacteria bacterium]